jgi:hypothetical protein
MTQLPVPFSLLNLGCQTGIVGLDLCLPEFINQYLNREKHFNIDLRVDKIAVKLKSCPAEGKTRAPNHGEALDSSLFFSWRYTTHSGCVFYSPLSGFSLLSYEIT